MLFQGYDKGDFCDEMLADDGSVRPHYCGVVEGFGRLNSSEWAQRQTATDLAFMRGGVTFTVYSDSQGTERIFPFDLVPRIIPGGRVDADRAGADPAHHGAESFSS